MVRHIVNKEGFTLIDTLFSFSMMMLLTSITLFYCFTYSPPLDQVIDVIFGYVEQVRYRALLEHKNYAIHLDSNKVEFEDVVYYFPNNIEIQSPQVITFNKNGNITLATSIEICKLELCKTMVFNLESGHMYAR